jgi:hypothetical protein
MTFTEHLGLTLIYSPDYYYNSLSSIGDNPQKAGVEDAESSIVEKPLADSRTNRRASSSGQNKKASSFTEFLNSSGKEWWRTLDSIFLPFINMNEVHKLSSKNLSKQLTNRQ